MEEKEEEKKILSGIVKGFTQEKKDVTVPLVVANIPNRDNIIYPTDVLKKAIEAYKKEGSNLLFGSTSEDILNVAGVIKNIEYDDDCVIADISFTDSTCGKLAQGLAERGCFHVGMSAWGNIEKIDGHNVVTDIDRISFSLANQSDYDVKLVDSFLDDDQKMVETFSEE